MIFVEMIFRSKNKQGMSDSSPGEILIYSVALIDPPSTGTIAPCT
jgi:hypothetical protein